MFHPIPSLSIGVVQVEDNQYHNHHEISTAAAVAKKQAKKIAGNCLFVERRQASSMTQLAQLGTETDQTAQCAVT